MLGTRFASRTLLGALLLACIGCANLGAVRDFASSSARLTGYKDVTERYVSSADRQLADLPMERRFDTRRADLKRIQAAATRDKDSLHKLHNATTGYMAALAGLAAEDAYSLSSEIDKVSGALTESKELGINADHVKSYANIVKRVVSWIVAAKQARDVKRMVKENGDDIDKLLEAMQVATEAYGFILRDESMSARGLEEFRQVQWSAVRPGDPKSVSPPRREVISSLLRRGFDAEQSTRDEALKAQQAAATGLAEVRQAHAFLVRNVDRLDAKDTQAMLKKAATDLREIRDSIRDL